MYVYAGVSTFFSYELSLLAVCDRPHKSSSSRAALEGEIAEPANDAVLDYLRTKKQYSTTAQDGALTTETGGCHLSPPQLIHVDSEFQLQYVYTFRCVKGWRGRRQKGESTAASTS